MLNKEKTAQVLKAYREEFLTHFLPKDDEKYKWEAVQQFQTVWDIAAPAFADMLGNALKKTGPMLSGGTYYPGKMIVGFAEQEPETVRGMFKLLFDETEDLTYRVDTFRKNADTLIQKYASDKNHYQNTSAISVYLWLRFPEKYYLYRYQHCKKAIEILGGDYTVKRNGSVAELMTAFRFYDELKEQIRMDNELTALVQKTVREYPQCYLDPAVNTLTMDIVIFISLYYRPPEIIDASVLKSKAKFKRWFAPILNALRSMEGKSKRQDVHQRILETEPIEQTELNKKLQNGSSWVLNQIDWARQYLTYEGMLSDTSEAGTWELTELGKKIQMTDELAGKIIAKWVLITKAQREQTPTPIIDLTPYYGFLSQIPPYEKQDFLNEVYLDESQYNTLLALLRHKKNIILQGAPGVGKTFAAKRLAYAMMGERDDGRICSVQFHQSYSYEDFVEGYKPSGAGFVLKKGTFFNFCQKAAADPDRDYFFLIDEINRGNLSRIFGELLMLLEKDYRGKNSVLLAYSKEPFTVPENLYLIGMMNTADRSLAIIDYALRRRFSFFEMKPAFGEAGFPDYQKSLANPRLDALIKLIVELNEEIKNDTSLGKGFRIGHSYFCGLTKPEECTTEWMKAVIAFDILPTLDEYWFDEPAKVKSWAEKFEGCFHDEG